jgi:TrmH family RNA methyltransferase
MALTKAQITQLRDLRHKRHREATRRYVVEGPKVIGELILAGHQFESIYATPDWITDDRPATTTLISDEEMLRISHYPTASSVLAVGHVKRTPLDPAELNRGLTLALDGIQDPGNVGTLIRIADWFGFQRVLLSPECADLFSQKVINASMGSFARVRVITVELAAELAATTVPVLGCDLAGESVHQLTPLTDAIVVIGSEGRGLSPAVAATVTRKITIPQHGPAESLNAAVAAGIVCAQLRSPL